MAPVPASGIGTISAGTGPEVVTVPDGGVTLAREAGRHRSVMSSKVG